MRILILIAFLLPLGDLFLLWKLIPLIGGTLVLAWVVLTIIIGITIVRLAGASALHNIRVQLLTGRLPGRQTLDDGIHVLGGLLLAFPGFITDLLAFPLLVRFSRRLAVSIIIAMLRKRFGVPEPDDDRPVYTIGPDGRPIRDVEVEIHDDKSETTDDRKTL
jgi:UPF0716 protein FxsA